MTKLKTVARSVYGDFFAAAFPNGVEWDVDGSTKTPGHTYDDSYDEIRFFSSHGTNIKWVRPSAGDDRKFKNDIIKITRKLQGMQDDFDEKVSDLMQSLGFEARDD